MGPWDQEMKVGRRQEGVQTLSNLFPENRIYSKRKRKMLNIQLKYLDGFFFLNYLTINKEY